MRRFTQRPTTNGGRMNLIMQRFSSSRLGETPVVMLVAPQSTSENDAGAVVQQEEQQSVDEIKEQIAVEDDSAMEQQQLAVVRSSDANGEQQQQRDLGQSIQVWVHNADALLHSREMSLLLSSSRDVALDVTGLVRHGAGVALHVACLPVTVPLHVVGSATDLVVGTCRHVVLSLLPVPTNCIALLTAEPSSTDTNDGDEEDDAVSSPVDNLVHTVTNVMVPMVLETADSIKNEIGGVVLGFMSPLWGGDDDDDDDDDDSSFLDRLRLKDGEQEKRAVSISDISKFLLPVDDLNLSTADAAQPLTYIDLCPDYQDKDLTSRAIEALASKGLALVSLGRTMANDSPIFIGNNNNNNNNNNTAINDSTMHWKAEGATTKLLSKKASMSLSRWYTLMERDILCWSCTNGMFLSRGVIPGSPRAIFDLLWDNDRTMEYNKYCGGRSDALVIEDTRVTVAGGDNNDDPSLDTAAATNLKIIKVLKGETKIPFTSMSVVLSTLVYGIKLESSDDDDSIETYLIVRRSLTSGGAGYHHDSSTVERGNTEITWGVNLLQSIRGGRKTDMITLSQASSSMIPRFLSHRAGMTGSESFFASLRSV